MSATTAAAILPTNAASTSFSVGGVELEGLGTVHFDHDGPFDVLSKSTTGTTPNACESCMPLARQLPPTVAAPREKGDLDSGPPDPAQTAANSNRLPRLQFPLSHQALHRGTANGRDRGRLYEGERSRLLDDLRLSRNDHLGERTAGLDRGYTSEVIAQPRSETCGRS